MSATVLHPAARRRLEARMPRPPVHDVVLRPLFGGDGRSIIHGAEEQDFIEAVLADAAAEDAIAKLAARRGKRRGEDEMLELSQPVHRRFHLILLEAHCREPGAPRLDPLRIADQGFVMRRREGAVWQGWLREGTKRLGWSGIVQPDADPDSATPERLTGAGPELGAILAARRGLSKAREETHPLFVASDEICAKAGKTILFGLVPVASSEQSNRPPEAPDYASLPADEQDNLRGHLSSFFKARASTPMPKAGTPLDPRSAILQSEDGAYRSLGIFLQQAMVELGALEQGAAAQELMTAFEEIALPLADSDSPPIISAAEFIARAAPILIGGEDNSTGLTMPFRWPAVDNVLGDRIQRLALTCLAHRAAAVTPPAPKFDGDSRLYAVRPFIRVEGHDDCPPQLVWGTSSEQFRILPWWDGDGPATRIALPSLRNLKRMKPNVSFQLPPELANLLQGNMEKLAEGKKQGGPSPELEIFWLCSFSIPIITLCAFIVLNIFLTLFDLIFSWLAFIKICIPIPKPK